MTNGSCQGVILPCGGMTSFFGSNYPDWGLTQVQVSLAFAYALSFMFHLIYRGQ